MGDSSDRTTVFSKNAFRYSQTDFLGAGAFGAVYRATMKSNGEVVAIKVLNTPARLRDREVDCLMKEVSILQRLSGCPNIIRLIGVCVDPRHYTLIMEYVENGDLDELLLYKRDDHPAIKQWDCRIRMGLDVARGMDFLHGQQPPIIHRDLKSANVLVDTNYCCKIIDFGLSQSRGVSSCESALQQRSHQNVAGTMAFIAPERFMGETRLQYPEKADVYSFSIVLWQLKEMRRPYEDEPSPDAVRANVLDNIRPAFSRDDCPLELRDFIPQCWRPQPQVRPHFSEIVTTLERILQSFVSQHSIVQQTIPSGSTGRVAVNGKLPAAHRLPSPNAVQSMSSSLSPNSSEPLPVSSAGISVSPLALNSSAGAPVLPAVLNSSTGVSVPFQRTSAGAPGRGIAGVLASPYSSSSLLETTGSALDVDSLVFQSAEHTNAATPKVDQILGSSVGSDEIQVISELPASKRRRLPDSRRVKNLSVIPKDTSKWMRWPDLPVCDIFLNNCVSTDSDTLVVANTQQVYSLNTRRLQFMPSSQMSGPLLHSCNWTVHEHFLGDGVVLHRLFTAGTSSFVTYYLNNSSDQKQSIARFDLQRKIWTHVCDLPSYQLLQNYSIVGNQCYAYIVGGENKTCNDVYDTVLKYDLNTGKLCERENLVSKRKDASSAILNHTLYVSGGSDGQQNLDSLETITLSGYRSPSWRPTSTGTYQSSLCACGNSLIATGGLESSSVSKMASVLGRDEVTWSPLPAMNEGRCCHGLCELGSCVVAVGGTCMAGSQLNSVEALSFLEILSCHRVFEST